MKPSPLGRQPHCGRSWCLGAGLVASVVVVMVVATGACARQPELDAGQAGGAGGSRGVGLDSPAGTGDGDSGQEKFAPVDPCSLITQFEIRAETGGQSANPERNAHPILVGMPMCVFGIRHDVGDPSTVAVGVWSPVTSPQGPGSRPTSGRQAFDSYKQTNKKFGLTDVDALGDDAVWDDGLKTLVVLESGRVLGVTLFLSQPNAPDPRQLATKVVQVVLPRLPR